MTKKLLILVGCITICLLTNLSLRVPTPVQAQAAVCITASAPAFTLGVQKNLPLRRVGIGVNGCWMKWNYKSIAGACMAVGVFGQISE